MSSKNGSVFQFGSDGKAPKDETAAKPGVRTVLGAGCSVEGKLICSGPTRLDGALTGSLIADDFLMIDQSAKVTADLNVPELVVKGTVKGNITATKKVVLEGTAQVEGDIETSSIMIADGAQVLGRVHVTPSLSVKKPNAEVRNLTSAPPSKAPENGAATAANAS